MDPHPSSLSPCSCNTGSWPKLGRKTSFPDWRDWGVSGVEGEDGDIGEGCEEKLSSEETLSRSLDGRSRGCLIEGSDSLCVREERVEGGADQDDGDLENVRTGQVSASSSCDKRRRTAAESLILMPLKSSRAEIGGRAYEEPLPLRLEVAGLIGGKVILSCGG